MSEADANYSGKVKYLYPERVQVRQELQVRVPQAPQNRQAPQNQGSTRNKRVKLLTTVAKKVKFPTRLVAEIGLRFWSEAGEAVYACLAARNVVSSLKQKTPRRLLSHAEQHLEPAEAKISRVHGRRGS